MGIQLIGLHYQGQLSLLSGTLLEPLRVLGRSASGNRKHHDLFVTLGLLDHELRRLRVIKTIKVLELMSEQIGLLTLFLQSPA